MFSILRDTLNQVLSLSTYFASPWHQKQPIACNYGLRWHLRVIASWAALTRPPAEPLCNIFKEYKEAHQCQLLPENISRERAKGFRGWEYSRGRQSAIIVVRVRSKANAKC